MAQLAARDTAQPGSRIPGVLPEVGTEQKEYRIISNTGFFFIERPGFFDENALLYTASLGFVGDLL